MSNEATSERLREGALYVVVVSIALVARIPSMGEGFWIDEVMSAATIGDPWGLLFTRVGFTDVHPPGYYVLLKMWAAVAGDGDTALRSLSLIASLGTVVLLMRWIRSHGGRHAALFGGVALACSPFHIHYSVEVRSYALFTLVALALAWRVDRWLTAPSPRGLWSVVALEIAALSLHYYALLWVVLLNIFAFTHAHLNSRPRRLQWLRGQMVALAALAAWLPLLLVQMFELPEFMKAHLSDDLPLARMVASLGPLPSVDPSPLAMGTGLLILLLALVGAWLVRARPLPPPPNDVEASRDGSLLSAATLAAALLVMPLVPLVAMPMSEALVEAYLRQLPWAYALVTIACALGGALALAAGLRVSLTLPTVLAVGGPLLVGGLNQLQPMLFLRNLLVFVPPALLLAAWALDRAPRFARIGASLLLLVLALPHATEGSRAFMPRQDFMAAAAALDGSPGGPIVVAPGWDSPGVARYRSDRPVVPAMSAAEIAGAARQASSVVVLLSRPGRLALSADDVHVALDGKWRLEDQRVLRGHRGPMQWLRYVRADDG